MEHGSFLTLWPIAVLMLVLGALFLGGRRAKRRDPYSWTILGDGESSGVDYAPTDGDGD